MASIKMVENATELHDNNDASTAYH